MRCYTLRTPRCGGVRRGAAGLVSATGAGALLELHTGPPCLPLLPTSLCSDLTILRPLGEGSYGKVYLASMRETLCAIKLLLSAEDAAAAVRSGDSAISLSSPVMQALEKVRPVVHRFLADGLVVHRFKLSVRSHRSLFSSCLCGCASWCCASG